MNFTEVAVCGAGPLGIAEVEGAPLALGESDCGDMFEVHAASTRATSGIHLRSVPARAAIWWGA